MTPDATEIVEGRAATRVGQASCGEDDPLQRRSAARAQSMGWAAGVCLLVGIALVLTYVPTAYSYYGRRATTLWDSAVCLLLLAGSTAFIVSLGAAVAVVLAHWTGMRIAIALSVTWAVLAIIGLRINLLVQSTLGNVAATYLQFFWGAGLRSLRWANANRSWLELLGRLFLQTLLPAALAIWLATRLLRTSTKAPRGWRSLPMMVRVLGVPWISAIVAAVAILLIPWRPPGAEWMAVRLPFAGYLLVKQQTPDQALINREATASYRADSPLDKVKSIPMQLAGLYAARPARTPDVLLVILESLRRDALRPEIMPNLWRFSERGVRFEHHSGSSSASHEATFALLFGMLPIGNHRLLRNVQPTLPVALKAAGYESHFVAGFPPIWAGMSGYMRRRFFEPHVATSGEEPERDRASIATAQELLTTPHDRPRFVVLYVIGTHFPYWYPSDTEVFTPAEPLPSSFDITLSQRRTALRNRYDNSVRHLDEGLARLFEAIDPSRTLVVAVGDHGESFFEDGTVIHMSRLSDVQVDVPLVMVGPDVPVGARRSDATTHTDIAPTIFERLGYPTEQIALLPARPLFDASRAPAEYATAVLNNMLLLRAPGLRVLLTVDNQSEAIHFLGQAGVDGETTGELLTPDEQARVLRWTRDLFGKPMWP